MKNRYGIQYAFEKVSGNCYVMVGDILSSDYWRMGGKPNQQEHFVKMCEQDRLVWIRNYLNNKGY